ncbi:LCP family protein [Parenemella sanctibonifatiensis]|uniref:Transcriptional regulator n=1 Tax=Parenemella sanctibonifatiensis TaxID=2016505 RepID=A0A255EIA6_9ACTN|nr:LCP family protein [Parenemella sanctibonifatiensis]OYN87873.1 transcriptional regulator [Parenemella sanctibonifatiensis]
MGDRKSDLDWLYGREPSEPPAEATRQMSAEEIAAYERSTQQGGQQSAHQQAQYQQPQPAPQPQYQQPQYPQGQYQQPQQAPPTRTRRTKRRRPLRTFRRVLTTVVVLWLAYLVTVPLLAWNDVERADVGEIENRPPEQPGTAVLFVGSDSREGLSPEQREQLRTGDIEGKRTDTMMLIYRPPQGKSVILSLPRDSFLPIPGHGENKLNAAYAFGGPQLLIETVEQSTGIRIDGYVEIGFGGFVNLVDAVDGIEVCLDEPMQEGNWLDIPAGCNTLDGVQALGYARMRKSDPTGDLGRMKRQREVLSKVADKALNPMSVINPVRYWNLAHAGTASLVLSQDTSLPTAVGMVLALMRPDEAHTLMVPISDPNARTSAGSSMIWDEDQAAELFAQIAEGNTEGLERFS